MKKNKFKISKNLYYAIIAVLIIVFISIVIYKSLHGDSTSTKEAKLNISKMYQEEYIEKNPDSKILDELDERIKENQNLAFEYSINPEKFKDKFSKDREENKVENQKTDDIKDKIPAGTYEVGKDIKAGEYVFIGDEAGGYIEINNSLGGELENIITNDVVNTFIYTSVEDGEYLQIKNGYLIQEKDFNPDINDKYQEGMYKVGRDIKEGQYTVYPEEGAYAPYVEVAKDSRGINKSIIFNDIIEGNSIIKVKDGEYLKLRQAYIEK